MSKMFTRYFGFKGVASVLTLFATGVLHADVTAAGGDSLIGGQTVVVSDVGPDSKTWEINGDADVQTPAMATFARNPGNGNNSNQGRRRIIEMETGMNYWDGNQWSPSDPSFQIADGWFVADKVQHKVRLFGNINVSSAVQLTTPDGIVLESTPLAIGLYDPVTGDSAVIASITNSTGVLVSSNQVVYQNAFDAVPADIVYTIEKGSFAQDIVLTANLDPTDWGFSTNSEIQIITEFYKFAEPDRMRRPIRVEEDPVKRANMKSPDFVDTTLGFGQFVFGLGKAYTLTETNTVSDGAIVVKDFVTVGSRTFLTERVSYDAIRDQLVVLPKTGLQKDGAFYKPGKTSTKKAYAAIRKPKQVASNKISPKRVAKIEKRGVAIDYIATLGGTLSGTQTFTCDETICVSGALICNGAVTIEGNTIFKYKTGASFTLNNSVVFATTQYSPVVFTSIDDDSVGDSMQGISGYTPNASPTNRYANPALCLNYSPSTALNNLRFNQCQQAIAITGYPNTSSFPVNITDCQLISCVQGISVTAGSAGCGCSWCGCWVLVNANNTLFGNVQSVLSLPSYYMPYANLTQCTVHNASNLISCYQGQVTCVNSLFANVTNNWSGYGIITGYNNGFFAASNFGNSRYYPTAYPFQSNACGEHYLLPTSGVRGVGDPSLLSSAMIADLKARTTYPPETIPAGAISNQLNLAPQAQRYQGGNPDLGYYYPAVDYVVGGLELTTGSSVSVTAGTVIGVRNHTTGFYLDPGSSFVSQGLATQAITYVGLPFVQEDSGSLAPPLYTIGFCSDFRGSGTPPSLKFRFSNFYLACNDYQFCAGTNLFNGAWSGPSVSSCMNLTLRDCRIRNGKIGLGVSDNNRFSGSGTGFVGWTNNLFERVYIYLNPGTAFTQPVYAYNNLFWRGVLSMAPTQANWIFRDNLFDQVPFAVNSSPSIDCNYNAYYQATNSELTSATNSGWATSFQALPPAPGANSLTNLTAPAYQTSYLGSYYLPTNSPTYNKGSRSSAAAGLYHYTTRVDQVKEGLKTEVPQMVDIGVHYVATANGIPCDYDGDGLPDYLEDANGNGVYDSGDLSSWQSSDTNSNGLSDYMEWLQGRNSSAPGTGVADTGSLLRLRVYTPLK